MRKEYDFSAARKNPYAAQLKKPTKATKGTEVINRRRSSFPTPDKGDGGN